VLALVFDLIFRITAFLNQFPENVIVLRKIKEHVEKFKKSYHIVKGFEQDLLSKVEALCTDAVEVCFFCFFILSSPAFSSYEATFVHKY